MKYLYEKMTHKKETIKEKTFAQLFDEKNDRELQLFMDQLKIEFSMDNGHYHYSNNDCFGNEPIMYVDKDFNGGLFNGGDTLTFVINKKGVIYAYLNSEGADSIEKIGYARTCSKLLAELRVLIPVRLAYMRLTMDK